MTQAAKELLKDISAPKSGKTRALTVSIDEYKDIKPYPYHVFTDDIVKLIEAGEVNKNWDSAYSGTIILTIFGLMAGNKYIVQNGTDWKEPLILFTLLYGKSSAAKSPPLFYFIAYLLELDYKARLVYREVYKEWQKRKEAAQGDKQPFEEIEPVLHQYIITDGTMEGLSSAMQQSHQPILRVADEAVSFFNGMNKYNGGGDDWTKFLEFYSAKSTNRRTKSEGTKTAENPYLSWVGCIQPNPLRTVFGKKIGDGLSYRFLIPYSDRKDQPKTKDIPEGLRVRYNNLVDRMNEIPFCFDDYGYRVTPRVIRESPKAVELYDVFSEKISMLINSNDNTYIADLLKKYRGICWRLAGILQLIYFVSHEDTDGQISERAMTGAIELSEYYISSSIKAHEDILNPNIDNNLFGVKAVVYEKLPDEFKLSEGLEVCARYGMPERSFKEFVKTKYFKKIARGQYEKL